MGAIGWIWAWLMLLGGVRAHLAHALPRGMIVAMIISGVIALPLLWSRKDGVFAAFAPSGIVRAGLALLVLVIAGIAHPSAMSGLTSA
jgi:hypothetical protein